MNNDPRKPQRMGITRKLTGLPPEKVQHDALMDAGCFPVHPYAHLAPLSVYPVDGDVFVAIDARVFKGASDNIVTEILSDGPTVKKKAPGPKPKLAKATATEWFCINWVYLNTKPKEGNAVALAAALGFDVDRFAIRNRSNKEAAEAELERVKDAAIGNEGKDT